MRRLSILVVLVLSLAFAGSARAFPPWMENGKAGRFMFNLKLGPAPSLNSGLEAEAAIVPEFGIAVDRDFNAYILLPVPNFQAGPDISVVFVPVGFQYDIPIKAVPGLYISPQITAGYAAIIYDYNCPGCQTGTTSAGFFQPEVSGKFIFKRRFNVGFSPFSLPVIFGNNGHAIVTPNGTLVQGGNFAYVSYRILFYGGINF